MTIKNTLIRLTLLTFAVFLAWGMGGSQDGPRRIPIPDQNFLVTITDRADVRTQVSMFSINSGTYFSGTMGKGRLAVPFSKVKRADFSLKPEGLDVLLSLNDGQQAILTADKNQDCTGLTGIGNFQISLGDIKCLTIDGQIQPPVGKK